MRFIFNATSQRQALGHDDDDDQSRKLARLLNSSIPADDDLDDFPASHYRSRQRSSSTALPTTARRLPPCRSVERRSHDPPCRCTTQRLHRPPLLVAAPPSDHIARPEALADRHPGASADSNQPSSYTNCWNSPTGWITSNHDEHAHTKTDSQGYVSYPKNSSFYFLLFCYVTKLTAVPRYIYT